MTGEAQARRWLDAAVDDLRHARYAEEGGFYAHACFSAQQAGEKAVKAVHHARGARAVLGHSVRNLIERLDPRVPSLDELLDDAREPDLNYFPTRYPNGLEAWTPAAGFGARQAATAIVGASAILRAVLLHLYIAWIHPFGDGNGRTARLAELMILAREGVPSPCAHLLSNHYNLTRAEYHRQLDRSSRANSGRGDPLGFLLYSLQGFVDGLREQCRFIARLQLTLTWEHFVYGEFQRIRSSTAMRRRREVTLALGRVGGPVRKKAIADPSPGLARSYAEKTRKTLTRDLNWLVKRGFLERGEDGYRARVETMQAFRPARA